MFVKLIKYIHVFMRIWCSLYNESISNSLLLLLFICIKINLVPLNSFVRGPTSSQFTILN